MTRILKISMTTLTVIALTIAGATQTAHATHFRGGNATWFSGSSAGPVTFPPPAAGTIQTEILSMDLSSSDPGGNTVTLPEVVNQPFIVDSFFDVFFDISIDGGNYQIDSFFDITYQVTGNGGGTWDTEIVAMQLSSQAPGGPPIVLRKSPVLPSPGEIVVSDQPDGTFIVDSFFDVFFEVSVDGGSFRPADSPMRLNMNGSVDPIPEPSTLALLGLAGLALATRRRRRQIS